MLYTIILANVGLIILAAAIWEGVSYHVFGKYLKSRKLVSSILKLKHRLIINPYNTKIISVRDSLHYFSIHNAIISKWYVGDLGQIPRWTKASRLLTKLHKQLLQEYETENRRQSEIL